MVENDIDINYLVASLLVVRPFNLWSERWVIATVVDLTHKMQQVKPTTEIFGFGCLNSELSQPEGGLDGQHYFEFKIIATVKS